MGIEIQENSSTPAADINNVMMAKSDIDVAGNADVTLSDLEAMRRVVYMSGTLTGNISVIFPLQTGKDWLVINDSSGPYSITLKVSGETGVTITQEKRCYVVCGDADIEKATAEL